MHTFLAIALLSVAVPIGGASMSDSIDGGSVAVTVQVMSAIGWIDDQPVVFGGARSPAFSVVTLDGYQIVMLC
jgi:hypothetical protein